MISAVQIMIPLKLASLWCQSCSVCIKLYLTLEQQRFELCVYTYTWISLKSKYSSTWPVVDWICRCRTMDMKGVVWGLGIKVLRECVISSVLSCHNKNLKQRMLKPLMCHSSQRDRISTLGQTVLQLLDKSVLQLCVTANFYLENKGKYILEAWGHAGPKDTKREWEREYAHTRERSPDSLTPLFMFFSFSPLGPALCKLG